MVIGTAIYWSDMTGLLKTFIDRHENQLTNAIMAKI
ncbi:NAD(P)H-dependent oxidoreductase [Listeria ivanovii]|nr:NAD(P)H-dependent oxidoreductase [Listeria ivanovii]MBM5721656.1 hypothetical protein [Listeria ivanovii]